MSSEKTYVEDVDRNLYDFRYGYNEEDYYQVDAGLTPEIVEQISTEKNDPEWMRKFRLESLKTYQKIRIPDWGPSIDGLEMDNIITYIKPKGKMSADWEDVP